MSELKCVKFFLDNAVLIRKKGHCRVDMSGENAFEYIDFYDFSQSDDEPEFLRSELQDDQTLKMSTSSTEISELVLPSGAVIGT